MFFRRPFLTLLLLALCLGVPLHGAHAREEPPKPLDARTEVEILLKQAQDFQGSATKPALEKSQAALALARQAAFPDLEWRSLLETGRSKRLLNDLPGAIQCAHDGLDLTRSLGNRHAEGEFFLLRGLVEWNQAKVPEATVSMMEAARLGEELGDKSLQIGSLYGRGIVRSRGDDLAGAVEMLEPALQLAEQTGDPRLGQVLNALAVVALQRKDYPRARDYLERAGAALAGGTNLRTQTYVQLNLGQVASETGDQEAAGRYLDQALAACERYEFRRGIADVHYLQGARQRRLGALDEAIRQLNLALALAEKLNHPDLFVLIYEEFIQTEQARGDFRAALDYTRRLAEKLDLVRGEKTRRLAAEIQARYEAEHHTQQIRMLQRVRALQNKELSFQADQLHQARAIYTLLIVTMVLGGVTLAALASRQRAHARLAERMLARTSAAHAALEIEEARKSALLTVAARDLRESETRFESAFEHSPLGLSLLALDGRWLRVNPALCKIVGYPREELLATNFQALTHPEDLDSTLQLVRNLLGGGTESYSLEIRYLHKAGHAVWVRTDVTLMRRPEDGRPVCFIAQVDDITERRRAREQLRAAKEAAETANEAKNGFLSRMSHELRTPLNAIMGFSQLLEADDLGERQNQSVSHICVAGRHLLDLINEVLDISQIESGRFSLCSEPTLVDEALRGAACLMEPLAAEAGLRLAVSTAADAEPLYIGADPRRLRQVILNLLSNAIKYNRPGGSITVGCSSIHGRVRIEVADTGFGIPPEDQETIFAPFTRLAVSESIEGSGLGLSVTKALTEVMDGHISVQSVPGKGSTFSLEFARLSAAEVETAALPTLEPLPVGFYDEPSPDAAPVLYIEDNADNVELVRYIFETMRGVRLVSAPTGRAGIEAARGEPPELILLDLNLPDMPGAAVLAQLRREPGLAQVPVIVMSADASMSQAETLRSLGARDYLTHPFDLGQFRRLVEETLCAAKLA